MTVLSRAGPGTFLSSRPVTGVGLTMITSRLASVLLWITRDSTAPNLDVIVDGRRGLMEPGWLRPST